MFALISAMPPCYEAATRAKACATSRGTTAKQQQLCPHQQNIHDRQSSIERGKVSLKEPVRGESMQSLVLVETVWIFSQRESFK